MTQLQDWAANAPTEVYNILEDWGYTRQDINIADAVHLTIYLLNRLDTGDKTDYYYCLQFEDELQYTKIKFECISFLYYFERYAAGKGLLEG
ncbi:hypothetical protein [Bacillus safensis]|uniref:Uncharacterized protein n=1 Tax=Bacillus safensis TaxID=561879 RepID=A0A1L6ZJ71_BACIA|nr:hypothetical protein [Bacillus safensis]APT46566.1 hypothetical protein BSA145_12340 [Bacillus safensis]